MKNIKNLRNKYKKKNMKFFKLVLILVFLAGRTFSQEAEWQEKAPGIWKITVGEVQGLTLLKAVEITPNLEVLGKLSKSDFPLNKSMIKTEVVLPKK